jgi:hypothetical protein
MGEHRKNSDKLVPEKPKFLTGILPRRCKFRTSDEPCAEIRVGLQYPNWFRQKWEDNCPYLSRSIFFVETNGSPFGGGVVPAAGLLCATSL